MAQILMNGMKELPLNVFPALKDGDFSWGALGGRPEIFRAR
jgi:hypothetical protein